MADYRELLRIRRSVRQYQDRQVPLDLFLEMIKESTLAPSSRNDQPWKFIIVRDREMIKKISAESKKNILARIAANPDDPAARYQKVLARDSFNVFYNAPCLLIIVGDKSLKNILVDCALAASYFMFAAADRGLGTCWVNLGADIRDPRMLTELGIPKGCRIVAPIIAGYPKKIPAAPERREPQIVKIIDRSDQ